MTGYYLSKHVRPDLFKPYDLRQAKRDRHDAHQLSHKLSGKLRRLRKQVTR